MRRGAGSAGVEAGLLGGPGGTLIAVAVQLALALAILRIGINGDIGGWRGGRLKRGWRLDDSRAQGAHDAHQSQYAQRLETETGENHCWHPVMVTRYMVT
jgi:hypothetical protein